MLKDKPAADNDDQSSSRSIVATLEDLQIDSSLLLEQTMLFFEQQITQIDKSMLEMVNKEASNGASGITLSDYLLAIFGTILIKQLTRLYKDIQCQVAPGAEPDRLSDLRNLQKLLSLIHTMIRLGALRPDSPIRAADQGSLTVNLLVDQLESKYIVKQIGNFVQAESERMFETLA